MALMVNESSAITPRMGALDWRALLGALWRSPWSFRLLCLYMLFEYVRPQSLYPVIAGPPYSLICILAASLAMLAEGRRPKLPAPLTVTLAGFSAVLLLSGVTASYPEAAIAELQMFGNWLLLILIVSSTVTSERKWFLFLLCFLLFSLKMSQHGFLSWVNRGFAFANWGVTGGPGWFQNSGEFALQMGIFVSLSISTFLALRQSLPRWLRVSWLFLPVSAVGSIIASSSRGGLLALVVIAVIAVLRTRYRVRAIAGLVVTLPLIWLVVPPEFKARFSTAGSDTTSQARLRFWSNGIDMANEHPVLGVGPGNWIPYYRDHYIVAGDSLNRFDDQGRLLVQPAHNSFVEVASQLGYVGLLSFIAIIAAMFFVNWKTRQIAVSLGQSGRLLRLIAMSLDDGVVVFCVAGFFMSVTMYPFIWVQLALTGATHIAARDKLKRSAVRLGTSGRPAVPSGRVHGARSSIPVRHRRASLVVNPSTASIPSSMVR